MSNIHKDLTKKKVLTAIDAIRLLVHHSIPAMAFHLAGLTTLGVLETRR